MLFNYKNKVTRTLSVDNCKIIINSTDNVPGWFVKTENKTIVLLSEKKPTRRFVKNLMIALEKEK